MKAGPGSVDKYSTKPARKNEGAGPAMVDREGVERHFFDFEKDVDLSTLQQAAQNIQAIHKPKEAPGINVLEKMRLWRHRRGFPMYTCPAWIIFLKSIKQYPLPKPSRPGSDASERASKKRAAVTDSSNVMQLLVHAGVVNAETCFGWTPIDQASVVKQHAALEVLQILRSGQPC